MVIMLSAVALIVLTVAFTFFIRPQDIPAVAPLSPTHHLEERRAAIYENLRDLQFEYRVGKLSDADYQSTKLGLQKELAGVMAEMDRMKGVAPRAVAVAAEPAKEESLGTLCPHCNAQFETPMKFCGACGKAMVV
ncbi:MAG: hypothetical protein ABIR70_08700 [Bryobacteraceae bacterium]